MSLRSFLTVAVAVLGLSLASTAHATTLVFSDDFSSPSGGGSFVTYYAGHSMGNWSVDQGSVDLIGGYWEAPSVGGGSVDLNGNTTGAISQGIALAAGTYKLTFSLSGNPEAGVSEKLVEVSVGDASQTFSYNTADNGPTRADMKYVEAFLLFTVSDMAADEETVLSFKSLLSGGYGGAVIGNVQISTVPLPAALPLFVVACGGVAAFARRRRQA